MAIFSSPRMRSLWACLLGAASLSLLAAPLAVNASMSSSTLASAVRAEKPKAVSDQGVETVHDIVVYGGTSAGVVAAVQARKMGKSVVLIEPTRRLGGLTSGGLGQTDIGNKAAIGGLARRF